MSQTLVTLSVYRAQDSSVSQKVLASRPLTTLVSHMALAHSAGLCPAFRCSRRLFGHFKVHACELEVKLLPVGSLPECAGGFPEPLLCSLYSAAQVTSSYGNRGTAVGEDIRLWHAKMSRPTAAFANTHSSLWTKWGETWSWAAFDTNRNLLTKMVALGFHEADKIIRFQTNSV